ncbi:hypothetical protein [Leisingera thetidis]|nr:hypothetical protein [Leisingera thetidis]
MILLLAFAGQTVGMRRREATQFRCQQCRTERKRLAEGEAG